MERTINTITDARNLINDWTSSYIAAPTAAQVERAARQLVAHIGGYGNVAGGESTEDFDLDAALEVCTVDELADIYGGGVIANDRGNGCGGPRYIDEPGDLSESVQQVTEADDPGAWALAREAADLLNVPAPTIVAVGERDGDGAHQMIYAV